MIFILIYAFLYRFRGSSQTLVPKLAVNILIALGFAMLVPMEWSIPVWILVTLALQTGHGNFIDLGTWPQIKTMGDERLEFIIKPLWRKISDYWYDFSGLVLTGLVVTLPIGIALHSPDIAIMGALKGYAYAIGRLVYPKLPVEAGEVLFGAVLGLTWWIAFDVGFRF